MIANEPIRIANVNVAQERIFQYLGQGQIYRWDQQHDKDSNKVAVKAQYGLNPVACKEGGTAKFNCLLEEASRLDSLKTVF